MFACCISGVSPEQREALNAEKVASDLLDKKLRVQIKEETKVHKLLLLGTGESGKSTVFKQMQIIYDQQKDFSSLEKATYRHVLRVNVVDCMQSLINGIEKYNITYEHKESQPAAAALSELDIHSTDFWSSRIIDDIKHLWFAEPAVAKMFDMRAMIQLLDSTRYLCENVDRIGEADYVPTKDDILRARLRTSGIVEKVFRIHDVDFKFLDVGGQRNERRKWIHCFADVTSVIYVAAISEYDQVLFEKDDQNRLIESIEQFRELSNLPVFAQTAFILFLNKYDLFVEKIPRVSMKKTCFPEFVGNVTSVDECLVYIEEQFRAARHTKNLSNCQIFCHATCATDTSNIERVFEACKLIILQSNLNKLGFGV